MTSAERARILKAMPSGFTWWLIHTQLGRNDAVGDLACEVQNDVFRQTGKLKPEIPWPMHGATLRVFTRYLDRQRAMAAVHTALTRAWQEYKAEREHRGAAWTTTRTGYFFPG